MYLYTVLIVFLIVLLVLVFVSGNKKENFTDNEENRVTLIPPIIIQTWKSKEISNPKLAYCQKRLLDLNPNFQYIFFDDEDMYSFMKNEFSTYWQRFKNLKYKIQQIDVFRLCAVYYYGGVYLDMDILLEKSLDGLLNTGSLIFPIEYKMNKETCEAYHDEYRFKELPCNIENIVSLGNYGMASSKNNPILLKIINNIFDTYEENSTRYEELMGDREDYHRVIYRTTGPDKITALYYTDQEIRNSITLIQNQLNNKSFQFGEYGTHIMAGSWKI